VTGDRPEATGTPQLTGEGSDDARIAPEAAAISVAPEPGTIDGTRFAHASEAEMARILDFYQVRWEYEPTTFPILWNLDGEVIESFAPDFYLPELELFLEMTTLKQRLVRKKNRKLRRLRELYPGLRIKLFYARDFRAMMLKYGRLALAEALSGTPGQVVPERAADKASSTLPTAPIAPVEPPIAPPVDLVEQATGPAPAVRSSPRSRGVRRRRRPRRTVETRAEQETGA
jgi:hypothetical protein